MPACSYYTLLQYLGHGFSGWQRQRSERTAQGVFEAALEQLLRQRVVTHASGRTDAGVHALGQVVSFATPAEWEPERLWRALNALTPPDMWVADVGRAPPGFHARRHATARRYRYVVGCDQAAASPFRRAFEWNLGRPLDHDALVDAARVFAGTHDFRAFSAAGQPKAHYRCSVTVADWQERPAAEGFIFTIEADRFLHRMVRFLVGAMVEVGLGRRPLRDLAALLGTTSNQDASPPAPPQGLYLVGARYPQPWIGLTS